MMSRCNRIRRHVVTTFALFAVAIAPIAAGPTTPHRRAPSRGPTRVRLQVLVSSSTTRARFRDIPWLRR